MQDFSIFDIVIIGITLALGLKGLFKGFIKEVFGLVGIIGGIFVASRFADVVGQPIAQTLAITSEATISLIGFVATLIIFWIAIYILGTVISKIFSLSGLGFIDRLFGFIFGSAKIFLILAVISHSLYQIKSFKDKLDTKFSSSLVFPLLLETGSYIVAPAQYGKHENGRETYGHSLVINPWGEIIAQKEEGVGFINFDINLDEVKQARIKIPSIQKDSKYSISSEES